MEKRKEIKKAKLIKFLVYCLIFLGVFVLTIFDHKNNAQKFPRLYAFGMREWLIHCEGQNRIYRLLSENYPDRSNSSTSPTDRDLRFLDENNQTLYYTVSFDFKSLDQDSVWRFYYNKLDIRVFVKKDKSKVLWGDEKVFEISANLDSLTVITKEDQKIKMPCQRKR